MQATDIYRRFVDEAVVKGDLGVVDELFDPRAVLPKQGDLDGLRAQLAAQHAGLDIQVSYNHQFTDREWVITHMTLTVDMTREFLGHPPTGKRAVIQEVEAARVVGGRIVEMWSVDEAVSGMLQLGLPVGPS